MHVYIYDQFLANKKFEKIVSKIEIRITDLGLNGKNCRVGPLKSLHNIVKEEMRSKPKTVVAIGNNETLNNVVNALGDDDEVVVGIIPVGDNNSIADFFGIADEEAACNILSARLVETIDLGIINNNYFISNAVIVTQGTIIEVSERYTIEPIGSGFVEVVNLGINRDHPPIKPNDGQLETFIDIQNKGFLSRSSDQSFLRSNQLIINNLNNHHFIIDEALEVKVPVRIDIAPACLQVIVGKERKF